MQMPTPPPGSPTPPRRDDPNAPQTPWRQQVILGVGIFALIVVVIWQAPWIVNLL